MADIYPKCQGTARIMASAMMLSLALATPAAHAAAPLDALYPQSVADHVPDEPSAAPQVHPAPPDKQLAPGTDLGSTAITAGIAAAMTLLVQIAACGLGFCVFAGF